MIRRLTAWLFPAVLLVVVAGEAAAQTPAEITMVTDARLYGDATRTRFVADLTGDVDLTIFSLADPYRIVIDLPEVHFQLDPGNGQDGRGLISAYRFGQISRGKSRIVLDATAPVSVAEYYVLAAVEDQPARLVVDLVATSPAEFAAEALAYQETITPPPARPIVNYATDGRIVVVIDPGHGGIDPGATSRSNELEKNIVLAFSRVLADQLRATGRYDVAMTRDDDSFLSLDARVQFARSHGADIFLSIHADSFGQASVRGTAVYTVSERASNEIAAALAAGENRADILAGVNLATADNEVADILVDLARRETKNFSVALARNIVGQLAVTTTMSRNAHQEAGFAVLKAPDVPSILVELGFLSNAEDERLLLSSQWHAQTAAGIVRAIDAFFATRVAGMTPF